MVIACIGWGSLIWDAQELKLLSNWQSSGPKLPVEFARVSGDGRLTLVLLEGASPIPTLWAPMDYRDVQSAHAALVKREKTRAQRIGAWPILIPEYTVGLPTIETWAIENKLDAVIWTALGPKFNNSEGRAPSIEDAKRYLKGLKGDAAGRAEQYIRMAPPQVSTSYRTEIERELGWVPSHP